MVKKLLTIRKEGHSFVLSVTKILPINWRLIQAEIVKENNKSITVKFTKIDVTEV